MEPEAVAPEAAVGQQMCGCCARGVCNTTGPRLGCLDSALAPQLRLSWSGTAGKDGLPVRSQKQQSLHVHLFVFAARAPCSAGHDQQTRASSQRDKRHDKALQVFAKQGHTKKSKFTGWNVLCHVT